MARIQKKSPKLDLSRYQTLVIDTKNNSEYFRLSEVPDTLTSGKNGFLIEGSTFLKPTTEIKIEVLDTEGNPLFVQPGEGIPEYYEGLSKLISIHVYENTPIGIGKITILGELETYIDENGLIKSVPDEWRGIYNVKWEKEIKINKNLLNETKVRFLKRPEIIIEELGESLFTKTISSATQTNGTIKGIAVTPALGTNLRNYAGGIIYYLKNESAPFQDGAKTISVSGTQIQTASVVEYINQYTLAVRVPHTTSQYIVGDFNGANYELNYEYASSVQESSLFGSFARFEINNLTTFVGDAERIKLYGKNNATSADFNLLYDARINSQNLLETVISGSVVDRGFFSASYGDTRTWNTYWSTQSLSGTGQISLDTNDLYKSVKFRNYKVKTNVGNDIRLEKDSEYTLEFYVYYKTPSQEFLSNTNDRLKIYAASGLRQGNGFTPNYYFTTSLDTLTGDNKWRNPVKISYNFIPNVTDDWSINFEGLNEDTTSGDTFWQIGSVKIYGSNELGYSPDEFGFTIPIQRQLEQETFDFRLEYYDINNNFVPIQNTATQTFVSGNISLLGKSIDLSVDKLFFTFDGNESAVPSNQTINFFANKTKILGNLLITSQAFDSGGVYIPPATFGASPYPGKLTSIYETPNEFSASLTVSDFNGPLHSAPPGPGDLNVDRILYTLTEGSSTQPIIKRISVARIVAASGSAGAPGAAGSDAKTVNLTANIFTIPYDGDGNEIGTNSIFLTASAQNHSGTVYYEFLKNGVSKQNTTSQYYTVLNIDEPTTSSVDLWRINTREGSSGGAIVSFDAINLFGVKAGSNAYTVILSNESHVLPVTNTGIVNYTGSGTDIQVYKGATELQGLLGGTPSIGQFSSSYFVSAGNISVGAVSLSGNKIRFNSHSAMTSDNATIAYTVYLEGLTTNFTKVQSLAKSFEGNDGVNGSSGSDARTVFLSSDKYVFYYNGDNIRTPLAQTASLTASAQTGSTSWGANIFYEFLKNSISKVNSTSPYYIITGSEIPSASVRDAWQVNLRSGSASGPVVAFDSLDIFGLKDGGDAKTVDLTSPTYIIVYDKNSVNPSPSTLFKVTGNAKNFASPLFRFTGDIDSPEGTYTAGSSSNSDTASFTPPVSYFSTPKQIRVGVVESSNPSVEVAFDTITIAAVQPGLDGISGSASTFYYIKPLTGTQLKNSQGTLEIQAVKVSGSTSYNLNSGSVVLATGSSANAVLQTGNGVSAGSNGVAFNAVFSSNAINGSRTIILKDTGSNEVYDTITLADITDGLPAGSGIASTLTLRRETNNTYTPSTASLTASFFGTDGIEYQERYRVYAYFNGIQDEMYATLDTDSSRITASIDNGDGTKVGLGFANKVATKDLNFTFEFRDPQINETSSFTETLYIISDGLDGDDAYTVVLTNEAHSVPVSNDNPPVFDFAGSGTQIIAYRGGAQLNSTTSTPISGTFSASYAVTTGNITVGSFNVSGLPITIGDHSNLTTNAATITYTINLENSASVSKVQTITRATEGDDGFSVFLTNDADTYPADENGNVAASSLAGIFTDVNVFKGTTQYNYNLAGGANAYKTGSIITSSNITISQSIVNNNVRITPQTVNGSTQISGSVLIPIVTGSLTFNRTYSFSISKAGRSGSNALAIILNPSNQSVSKSKAGLYQSPVTFSVQVFETGSALLYTGSNNTLQSGYFTIHLRNAGGTLVPATGSISASIAPPLITTDTGVSSSFAVQYRDSKGNLSSFISQSHFISVVREGNDGINGTSGSDAFSVSLVSNKYTFTYDQNGNLSPLTSQTASLTAFAQTGSGAKPWGGNLFYQFQKNGTTVSPSNYSSPFWIVSESVGSSAIPAAGGIDVWQVNLLSGSGQTRVAFDNIDLFGLRSGSDAYTVFLTNEAHTFPADDQGNVSSPNLTVGATDVRFFRGISQYTYNQTGGTNTYKTGSIISSSNITISQSIVNNDVRITPTSVSGLTQLSGSIIIPVTDNATNVTFTKTYTYSISKEGTDAYTVILTNEAHTLPTTNTGTVTYTNSGTSIVVYKADVELNSVSGTPTTGQFSVSAAVTTGTITVGAITVTGNPAVVADHSNMTTDLAVIEYTINIENLVSIKKYQSLAKSKQGDNGNNSVTILVTPETQVVSQSVYYNLFSSASKFDIFVYETGSALTYTTTQPPTANSTFTVYAGNNGQTNLSVNNNKSGSIRPPHTTTGTGSINQFSIQYKDSKGVVSQQISASHIVSVNRTGTTGPGVVFTGQWSSSRFYQYTDGAINGRRDVVVSGSNNRYYATLQSHTAGASNYPTDGANNAFWEFLGTEDYFVAAKIAIFEESYVRNTLNIGTNGSIDVEGAPAKANITIYGNTTNPYIAIGQTVQGYNQRGIWLGNDAGNFKMSLTSGSSNFLTWDGSNLSIGGSITVTGGNAATTAYADQAETDAIASANLYTLSQTASLSSSVTPRIRTDSNGKLINAAGTTPSVTGLYLGNDKLGYYNTSTGWRTYMDSAGNFALNGSANGSLLWDAASATLVIKGKIDFGSQGSGQNIAPILMRYDPRDGNGISSANYGYISSLNGTIYENAIDYKTDPFGNTSLVWQCYPDGDAQADGGWNSLSFPIDNTKTYKFILYVKKYTSTAGGLYWGFHGRDSTDSIVNVKYIVDGSETSNPYFFNGNMPNLNRWYAIVGYVHGKDYTGTTHKGGVYDCETGQKVYAGGTSINQSDIISDYKWKSDSVLADHRSYHYYNASGNGSTLYQEMWGAGVYEVDGNEPDLNNILDKGKILAGGKALFSDLGSTFISENAIYSPNIAGANGYISDIFRVGATNGIVLDGRPASRSIYIGAGKWDDVNTGFFVSASGDFSLGNAVSWNNSNSQFRIRSGTIEIGATNRTTINSSGQFYTNNADISGRIISTNGTIGGWEIETNKLSAATNAGSVELNTGANPAIKIYSGSANKLSVNINAAGNLSNTSSVTLAKSPTTITTSQLRGSSNNNAGTDISGQYSSLSSPTYISGSSTRLTGSSAIIFDVSASNNNSVVTINLGTISANGSNSASFKATVDSAYYISNTNFTMRYGFALYSASSFGGSADIFVDAVSKNGTGTNTFNASSSPTQVNSNISYAGSLVLSRTLTQGTYHIIPFVDNISISATATEVPTEGCGCPSYGTFAYYGDCVGNSQEVYRYTGNCTEGVCDVYVSYEGNCI